ncbi:hypothetical protein HM1_1282 [Heliomicrobium modesticaldum Ice1]|uniref:Uncharacterized protein n=1 Tax=Heliobacterium modesticaldum (strain ATCC 51547 / Ice1) TaxID=498761 RepID=B0TGX0_HELMI|nr:hypothetical protein [Heliomicrobium modesticaldum]ABZ83295.1 hypothetical protein HM1_1282 [Heliomicrobium modesticaldum Ice1]
MAVTLSLFQRYTIARQLMKRLAERYGHDDNRVLCQSVKVDKLVVALYRSKITKKVILYEKNSKTGAELPQKAVPNQQRAKRWKRQIRCKQACEEKQTLLVHCQ